MAKLLRLDGRAHWKDCTQSEAEEARDADAFKAAFGAVDFSLAGAGAGGGEGGGREEKGGREEEGRRRGR